MTYQPGDPVQSPVDKMETLDFAKLDTPTKYKLLIGAIVPRPIAFVSTINEKGETNLAPFSFYNGISSNPPVLMISVARKPTSEPKDTLRNILETKQFVVNSASSWLLDPVVYSGGDFPYGQSEFNLTNLTPIASHSIKPPRVKESPIHFECELYKAVDIGDGSPGSSVAVFGKVLLMHIMQEAYVDGKIILEKIDPIARLGGISYTNAVEKWKKPSPKI